MRDTSQALRHYVYGGAIAAVTAIATVVLARALPIEPTLAWYALLATCASAPAVGLVHWVATLIEQYVI